MEHDPSPKSVSVLREWLTAFWECEPDSNGEKVIVQSKTTVS